LLLGCVLPALFASAPAAAQSAGTVAPPTRGELEGQTAQPPTPPPAQLQVEGGIERAPCALDRPEYAGIRFTPREVVFEDLRGLPAEALRSAYLPYLGQEQSVAVVCEIRDRAATILRDAGYIAAVEVPQQTIADGHLRFQVLMAKLVGIRVRGNAGHSEKQIASYLEPLTRDEVFNRFTAERALLLASELPGYSVRLALRSAGQARGEVIGEVTVLHTPLAIDANVQNYGSHALGRWGAMLRGQFFGLTGLGDRTTVSLYSSLDFEEQQTLQLGHDFRIGNDGLAVSGQFTYSWTHPDLGDDTIDVRAKTLFATLEASYPLIRSQRETVRGAIGLDLVNQDVEFNDADLSRDRLRALFGRLTADVLDNDLRNRLYTMAEPHWRLGGMLEIRQGLDVLGASEDCRDDILACVLGGAVPPSRIGGNPTATVFRTQIDGEFRPIPRLTLAGSARGQYASSPLLSFEQFSAGNYTVGRGYDPGSLLGDRGIGFQAELRYGSTLPRTRTALAVEPYVFVDQAFAWSEGPGGRSPRQELTSIGGGVRASLGDRFRLDVTFAAPLDRLRGASSKPDPRLLVSLTSRLWPWSNR
jgi:hemolysin activation/secretion protein